MRDLINQLWISGKQQVRNLARYSLVVYLSPVILLLFILFCSLKLSIPVSMYMKDPVAIGKLPFYAGVISNAGVLFWFASCVICCFTFVVIRNTGMKNREASFYIYFGVLAFMLMLDDLLLLHEQVFPNHLGTSEKAIYLMYLVLLVGGILLHFRTIVQTNFVLLLLGSAFLGLSIFVDFFQERIEDKIGQFRILFEDGFKFTGIVGWFGYFSNCAYETVFMFIDNRVIQNPVTRQLND
jgi:hypothetical protein